ncbi:UNVERIFIED_CONTAM: Inorganic phosphate transporter pho84 [Siphonaria sp. JEL0065]|nr:Inorganic phosphate transporter pho84 [Siphonaria sp. JEL0065]
MSDIENTTPLQFDNTKEKVLQELDDAKFNWVTAKTIAVAGLGSCLTSTICTSFIILFSSIVKPILTTLYPYGNTSQAVALMGAAATAGSVVGQLMFGFLGDKLGRKSMYATTMMIIIVANIGLAFSSQLVSGLSMYAAFGIWQLFIGVGIGGDYPMAATISGEFASTRNRGMIMSLVFSNQGLGRMFCAIVALVLLVLFKAPIAQDVGQLDAVWRILVVIGLVPSFLAIYSRFVMPESPRYTAEVHGDYDAALKDTQNYLIEHKNEYDHVMVTKKATPWKEFKIYFSKWQNMKKLIGTAGTWFITDIAVYGLGVNQAQLLASIGISTSSKAPYDKIFTATYGNLIVLFFGFLPGCYAAALVIDRMGRRNLQMLGFIGMGITYVVIAAAYDQILSSSSIGLVILYIIGQFFQNFGSNTTTFIISAELYPTKIRSTAHGLSAACGKCGAVIATYGVSLLVAPDSIGVPATLGILGGLMLLGAVVTYFFVPETKGIRLEDVA